METSFDDRADQTVLGHVHRCVGQKEYIEMRNMMPRYIRCTMRIDCRMCPTAVNASQLACFEDGMRIGYFRVPAMQMADIEKRLRNGICSLHGGCTRMDLRYCGPSMGFTFNGINNMSWGWWDPITGQRNDCTSPINGTLPTDRDDDVIFMINVRKLKDDCFILWHD